MKHRLIACLLILTLAAALLASPIQALSVAQAEGDWKYEIGSNGLILTGYQGKDNRVVVPSELAGQSVVQIGTGCFQNNTKIMSVEIPHGIRLIGEEAFYGCSNLSKIHIGGSINEIGDRAFALTGLSAVVIPGSVRRIGEEAFRGCEKLYNIVIEEGVGDLFSTEIGDTFGSGSVQLNEGIEIIGSKAFYGCNNLTMMRIPSTVTTIDYMAIGYGDDGVQRGYQITGYAGSEGERYANENGFTFVSTERAEGNAGICGEEVQWSFNDQNGMLTISGSGRMYDYASAERLPWYALRSQINCAVVEEGITSLGEYLFSDSAVSSVSLPVSLKFVCKRAFANCDALSDVVFPGDAPEFDDEAFYGTTIRAEYPSENVTWTHKVMLDYGGDVTWYCENALPFVDVPKDSFYYDAVAWAVDMGITTGTDAEHFSPNAMCQRAAVVTFLWRAVGSPSQGTASMPFVDVVEGSFYEDAVLWAAAHGVTSGTDANHFSPFAACNRAQVVTFLWRTMGCPKPRQLDVPFTDVEPDSWYAPAVAWAVEHGITAGMSAEHFGVNNTCNRAQIVTFLYKTFAD